MEIYWKGQRRTRRMSGPGDSQDLGIAEGEGSPLAGPLQPQGRSLDCVVLGTEAFLGGGPWLLWLWTCQFSDISQEGSYPISPLREFSLQWGVLRSPRPSLVFWPGQYGGEMWAVPSFTVPLGRSLSHPLSSLKRLHGCQSTSSVYS